jgi:ABC-type methionine transport system ATPase subunit
MHDIQVTTVIELGNKVGMIFQKLNTLSKKASEEVLPRDLDIEDRILQTEMVWQCISNSRLCLRLAGTANITNVL